MNAIIAALPILPGQLNAWRRFMEDVPGVRRIGADMYERRVGHTVLRVWHQATALGDLALVYQDGSGGVRSTECSTPHDPPAAWNHQQMRDIHGVDLDQVPIILPALLFAPEGQPSQPAAPPEPKTHANKTQLIYPC